MSASDVDGADLIVAELLETLPGLWSGEVQRPVTVFEAPAAPRRHEFLFFIKPELIRPASPDALGAVLRLITGKLDEYRMHTQAVRILPAAHLQRHRLMEAHYGVINRLAHAATASLTATARQAFAREFHKPVESATVLGGFEFLERFPHFTAASLDALWAQQPSSKLAPGTYCRLVNVDSQTIYLVNGFHPAQITHFTAPGRAIVVFALAADLDWRSARHEFLGATDPTRAKAGSIRAELLLHKRQLALPEVSQAVNGVHLSAGPIEALIELCRYTKDEERPEEGTSWKTFRLGEELANRFTTAEIESALRNRDVDWNGRRLSIFELTEEINSDEAVERLLAVRRDLLAEALPAPEAAPR